MPMKTATFEFTLPIVPVPASRPRVTRQGRVYYGKNYTKFRKSAGEFIDDCTTVPASPFEGILVVGAVFYCPKPKTTKRVLPRGDIDNYLKTLDVFNGVLWVDDDQIAVWTGTKCFSTNPRIELEVTDYGELYPPRAVREMRQQR